MAEKEDDTLVTLSELRPEVVQAISDRDNWIFGFLMQFDVGDLDRLMSEEEARAEVELWNKRKALFVDIAFKTLPLPSPNFYLPDIEMVEVWEEDETKTSRTKKNHLGLVRGGKKYIVVSSDSLGKKCKELENQVRELLQQEHLLENESSKEIFDGLKYTWRECVLAAHPFLSAQGLKVQDKVFAGRHGSLVGVVIKCKKEIQEL